MLKEGILSGLFSATCQNGDQYYDAGRLWPLPYRRVPLGRVRFHVKPGVHIRATWLASLSM